MKHSRNLNPGNNGTDVADIPSEWPAIESVWPTIKSVWPELKSVWPEIQWHWEDIKTEWPDIPSEWPENDWKFAVANSRKPVRFPNKLGHFNGSVKPVQMTDENSRNSIVGRIQVKRN